VTLKVEGQLIVHDTKTTLGDSFISVASPYILTHLKAFWSVFIDPNLKKMLQKVLLLLDLLQYWFFPE